MIHHLMPNHLTRARRVLDLEIAALRDVKARLDDQFTSAVDLLAATVQRNARLIVTGVGKSGHIAAKLAATFTSTGAPAHFLDPLNATHGDLGVIRKGDSVIALSYSGETDEIIRILPAIKRVSRSLIALTGKPTSTLAHVADAVINVAVRREACPHNLAPTSSTTAMLAVGDAMAMALLEARGFSPDDFARNHPGGALGRHLLLRAADVMRPLDKVAVMNPDDLVSAAIRRMAQKRCGAAVVISPNGTLLGIYTHGDFSRGYIKDANVGSLSLKSVMTRGPITVRDNLLVADVICLLESHSIDDLVVVNARRKPVGLIDVQDLV